MHYIPHEFQQLGIDHALQFLRNAEPGAKTLYASPTGTGKSIVELKIQGQLPGCWIITPRYEIIEGMMHKLGVNIGNHTPSAVQELAFDQHITTPIVFRNRLLAGQIFPLPEQLIYDEGHHWEADSWKQIELACGFPPSIALTATPFRGSARSTIELRKSWGQPIYLITYPEALKLGYLRMPEVSIVPLIDDDEISISNGEFNVEAIESQTATRFCDAVLLARQKSWCMDGVWDKPTMYSFPTRNLAIQFAAASNALNLTCQVITAETSRTERRQIFAFCIARQIALIQINTVSEGVDLPMRRLVDLTPIMSPVKWLQMFGRITRPTEEQPEYVCTNRNLLRHAYLLEGCLPPALIAAAQAMFTPSARTAVRVFGLESLGRLRPIELPFANGMKGTCYCVSVVNEHIVTEIAAIVHPLIQYPIWASRDYTRNADGTKGYGKWRRIDAPEELTAFNSITGSSPTEKQQAWWTKQAARYGLDPDAKLTRKNFQALPILVDLNLRFK